MQVLSGAHHGLEVEERLQAALRDLRLVRGVGSVPPRGLKHVAEDDGRNSGLAVAHADEVFHQLEEQNRRKTQKDETQRGEHGEGGWFVELGSKSIVAPIHAVECLERAPIPLRKYLQGNFVESTVPFV